jgi:hypothetical protein
MLVVNGLLKSRGGIGISLTGLTFLMFVPVPCQVLDFLCVLGRFVDIGGIDDYHCLNFLFIMAG